MYIKVKKSIITYLQTFWIVACGGFMWSLSRLLFTSLWVLIPAFIVFWIISSMLGITLLGWLDSDVRLSSKIGIKVENLPLYRKEFEKLLASEERGEDTSWIGDSLPDPDEWQRFLLYEINNNLTRK